MSELNPIFETNIIDMPAHSVDGVQTGAVETASVSRLARIGNAAGKVATRAIIWFELLPLNEAARFGIAGYTQYKFGEPLLTAASFSFSTVVLEGGAAHIAAKPVVEGDLDSLNWINGKLDKIIPEDTKMSLPVEAGLAMVGGTIVTMAERQRENPQITVGEARKRGWVTAGLMGAYFQAETGLVALGIENWHDPKTVGAALIGVGGITAVSKKIKKSIPKVKKSKKSKSKEENE